MLRLKRVLLFVALLAGLCMQVPAAFAAPTPWSSIDVTVHPDQQQTVLMVAGQLPETVTLPYEAELAVPEGTQLQWIGEILGGDPAQDPQLTYTKTTADGADLYRFTLTTSRIAQIEATIPSVSQFDGTNYATTVRWTASQDVSDLRLSYRLPQGAKIVQAHEGASVQPGGAGPSYYVRTLTDVKAGETAELVFSHTAPTAAPAGGAQAPTGSGDSSAVLIVFLLVVLGGLAVFLYRVNRKMAGNAEDENSESDAAPRRKAKPAILIVGLVALFVVGFAIAGTRGTSATVIDGKISRHFGSTSECQTAVIPYTVNDGVDLATRGDELLDGFDGMEGVGQVTVDLEQSTIKVGWCESYQTEAAMRQVLEASALITLGQ